MLNEYLPSLGQVPDKSFCRIFEIGILVAQRPRSNSVRGVDFRFDGQKSEVVGFWHVRG